MSATEQKPKPVHKEIVGVRQGGIESDPDSGWTTFSIAVDGSQYPVKLSTKKPELVSLATAVGKQTATWGFLESDGNPNPHGGFYKNRWLADVTPLGLDQPEAGTPIEELSAAPHPADSAEPPAQVVDASAKDRRITRMACLKAAAEIGMHIPVEHDTSVPQAVMECAAQFEAWVYRPNVTQAAPEDLIAGLPEADEGVPF